MSDPSEPDATVSDPSEPDPSDPDATVSGPVERPDLILPGSGPGTGPGVDAPADGDDAAGVAEPAKVMRIGTMIKQLLDEVRATPLDEPSRERLKGIYAQSVAELASALSPDLQEELARLTLPFEDDELPTDIELRLAQAQLVGWLEGLFHGIQATLFAQQMAARQQLERMRGQLGAPPGGPGGPGAVGGADGADTRPGTYL